jgi:hypothetical protein
MNPIIHHESIAHFSIMTIQKRNVIVASCFILYYIAYLIFYILLINKFI